MDNIDKKANEAVKNIQEGESDTNPEEPIEPEKPSLAKLIGQSAKSTNQTVYDCYGNKIVIPANFIVKGAIEGDIEYRYTGNGEPSIQDGVVIEDNDGNQFVWIPVGSIKNSDKTTTTITLGRYGFNTTNGTPTLVQDADNYTATVSISNCREYATGTRCVAKDLGDFVNKTKVSEGYYIARYEASKNSEGKLQSKSNKPVSVTADNLDARNMYDNQYYESDLINSYSWDTAIVFIQNYSGNSNYANRTSKNSSKVNTGKAGDKVCNIHDMASNYVELTTERSFNSSAIPLTIRGGAVGYSLLSTAFRESSGSGIASSTCVRVLLYVSEP